MRKGEKGFTLIEVTIIILVLVILGAILTPVAERYIELARLARVREDLGTIASAIEMFKVDICHSWFRQHGGKCLDGSANRVDLIVGDGDIPATNGGGYLEPWIQPVQTSAPGDVFAVDTMHNQLVVGMPYGAHPGYRRDISPLACGFRGPYLPSPVLADPWGNRYAANVAFLAPANSLQLSNLHGLGAAGATAEAWAMQPVYVLSAGPDGEIETPFVNGIGGYPTDPYAYTPRGDDQVAMIKGSF